MSDAEFTDTQETRADATLGPTKRDERILALDAARGLAILGVFCVNVQLMALPIAKMFEPAMPKGTPVLDTAAWAFVRIFCEGKFYPLFSMLFGMGFILLIDRASARGTSAVPLYLRRIVILFAFGALHISLLWYGDILLLYSICAIALLLAKNASTRVLVTISACLMALTILTSAAGIFVMQVPTGDSASTQNTTETQPADEITSPEQEAEEDEAVGVVLDPDLPPVQQFIEGLPNGIMEDPKAWAELEVRATRDGPFMQAFVFRLLHYLMFMSFAIPFGFGPSVLAMFFLGAAIMRSKALENTRFLMTALGLGMVLGLPAAATIVFIAAREGMDMAMVMEPIRYALSPLVSLMYLSALALLARSSANHIPKLLAPVGRMALTNYLTHSLVLAILMQHWGFGLFGTFSRSELLGTVFAIYLGQIAFSHLWLSKFRFGPMEWIWRSLTYLKPQPLVRRKD